MLNNKIGLSKICMVGAFHENNLHEVIQVGEKKREGRGEENSMRE